MYTLVNPRVNWLYTSEPSEWTGGRRIAAPRGKTLGGSSSINGHIYNRGQRLDFDGWAQRGNRGWGYADVLPYFRRSERRMARATRRRRPSAAREGNLPITDLDWRDPICDAFIEGAVQMGIPRNRDYNGTHAGGRQLRPAHHPERPAHERRARLPASGDEARRTSPCAPMPTRPAIVLEGKRAVGIRYRKGGRDGTPMEVRAAQGGDPVRRHGELRRSCCRSRASGRRALLQSLGIAVKHELRGVGENLRDHYAPRFVARVKNAETINEQSHGLQAGRRGAEIRRHAARASSSLNPTLVYVLLEIRRARSTTTTCSSPSRRRATRRACSRRSTTSRA